MTSFVNRMVQSAKLNADIYEEVEADRTAMPQAMGVVILSSVAAGIGSLQLQPVGFGALFLGTVSALLGWVVWAGITYFIGTRIMPEPQTQADYGELLRTIGFASSPGILRILGVVPGLTGIVFIATSIQIPATIKAIPLRKGMMPNTRIKPGELEKPIVRKSSPTSALVCGSGSSFVPIT